MLVFFLACGYIRRVCKTACASRLKINAWSGICSACPGKIIFFKKPDFLHKKKFPGFLYASILLFSIFVVWPLFRKKANHGVKIEKAIMEKKQESTHQRHRRNGRRIYRHGRPHFA